MIPDPAMEEDSCLADADGPGEQEDSCAVQFGPTELPPMPWFGMDIGGTLAKLVYFEPTETSEEEEARVKNIRKYLTNNLAYGAQGHRDQQKQMEDVVIRNRKGRLHFIRFPTCVMTAFIELAKEKGMAETISTVCATGGGAYKFEADIRAELNMSLHKVRLSSIQTEDSELTFCCSLTSWRV